MLYALTSAYSRNDYDNHKQGRPLETNIGKLFSLFAWGMDIVHENAELVKQWDDLERAKGAVLDRYGANWGVQRFSKNDALYRLAIRVKILSQLSGGDTDTVIRAASDLLGVEDHDIDFEDVFPAKIFLYVDWLLLTQERQDRLLGPSNALLLPALGFGCIYGPTGPTATTCQSATAEPLGDATATCQ